MTEMGRAGKGDRMGGGQTDVMAAHKGQRPAGESLGGVMSDQKSSDGGFCATNAPASPGRAKRADGPREEKRAGDEADAPPVPL